MVAAWESALVRALISVDSEVIEEVVPLSEHFAASRMSAAEKSYDSSCRRAPVLIDHILVCVWHMFVDSYGMQVKVGSFLDQDLVVLLNNFSFCEVLRDIEVILVFYFPHCHLFFVIFGGFNQLVVLSLVMTRTGWGRRSVSRGLSRAVVTVMVLMTRVRMIVSLGAI